VSCRFTTGAIRVDDRTHVVLPRIGRIHTHEPATALLDKVTGGQARILAATASFDGRRWYCAFTVETGRETARPAHVGADRAHPVVGVDAGVRDLLVVAAPDGAEVARVPAPRSLAAAQARLRAVQRRAARQDGPDRRAGSGPVAGRGASQKTPPGGAGGNETSTRHQPMLDKTGTAPPQGEAA
jgi:putative transposase